MNDNNVPISIRRPALIYYSLTDSVMDSSFREPLEELTDKDLYVLQALLNQASRNLHLEMGRRTGDPYQPF